MPEWSGIRSGLLDWSYGVRVAPPFDAGRDVLAAAHCKEANVPWKTAWLDDPRWHGVVRFSSFARMAIKHIEQRVQAGGRAVAIHAQERLMAEIIADHGLGVDDSGVRFLTRRLLERLANSGLHDRRDIATSLAAAGDVMLNRLADLWVKDPITAIEIHQQVASWEAVKRLVSRAGTLDPASEKRLIEALRLLREEQAVGTAFDDLERELRSLSKADARVLDRIHAVRKAVMS